MASIVRQFSDLNLSFIPHPITGDISKLKGTDAIRRSIRNLVLTDNYERIFQPEIGSGVYQALFDLLTPVTKHDVTARIANLIAKYEPRVRVNDINVLDRPDSNEMVVNIIFTPLNATEPIVLDVILKRVR